MSTVTFHEALELSKKKNTCVKYVTAKEHIGLNPRFIGNVGRGLREQLNSQLNLYSERLEGVPIAFGRPKCRQRYADILDEQPFLHFDCEVDAVVFQPKIGDHVEGVVNKLGHDHVSCLVHHVFNAAIHRPRDTSELWAGSQLMLGQHVLLKITKLNIYHGVVNIRGVLVETRSNPDFALDAECDEVAETCTAPGDAVKQEASTLNADHEEDENANKHRKKKKKKDKRKSDQTETEKTSPVSQTSFNLSQIKKEDNDSIGSLDSGLGALTPPKDACDSSRKERKKAKKAARNATDVNVSVPEVPTSDSGTCVEHTKTSFDNTDSPSQKQKKSKKKKKHKERENIGDASSMQCSVTVKVEPSVSEEPAFDTSPGKHKKKRKKSCDTNDVQIDESGQNLIVIKPEPDFDGFNDDMGLSDMKVGTFSLELETENDVSVSSQVTKKKKKKRKREDSVASLSISNTEQLSSPVHKQKKRKKKASQQESEDV